MPTDEGLPDVGDVIMSSRFMYAKRSETGSFLKIMSFAHAAPTTQLVLETRTGETHTRLAVSRSVVGDAYDSSRAHAEFVVEEARWIDDMVTITVKSSSLRLYVTARRLKANGTYNSKEERIVFFMCGLQDESVLAPKDLQYMRKMRIPKT